MKQLSLILAACLAGAPLCARAQSTGLETLGQFRGALAETTCANAVPRWERHYAPLIARMTQSNHALMPRFAAVLELVLKAGLPAEYAVIPFVESHYEPRTASGQGPAGMWQFTAQTARAHGLKVGGGSDQRFSAVASTRAAVDYLKRLHGQFQGRWRDVVMAYNAGDARLRQSQRGGRELSGITRAYPEKIHTIACSIVEQAASSRWHTPMQRPVAIGGLSD